LKSAFTVHRKELIRMRKTDDSDYSNENNEIDKISRSNHNMVDKVETFVPAFSSELNQTSDLLSSVHERLHSLEQQHKQLLLSKLDNDVELLHESIRHLSFHTNFSLETLENSMKTSLVELRAAQKELSDDQALEKVDLNSKLTDGLQSTNLHLSNLVNSAVEHMKDLIKTDHRKIGANVNKVGAQLSAYESSVNESIDTIQHNVSSKYSLLSTLLHSLDLSEAFIMASAKQTARYYVDNTTEMQRHLDTFTQQIRHTRVSALELIRKDMDQELKSANFNAAATIAAQGVSDKHALKHQEKMLQDLILQFQRTIRSGDINNSRQLEAVKSAIEGQINRLTVQGSKIHDYLELSVNTSTEQAASLNSRMTNTFSKFSDEQQHMEAMQQAAAERTEEDIDAGLRNLQLNLTMVMQNEIRVLQNALEHSLSLTNGRVRKTDDDLDEISTRFSRDVAESQFWDTTQLSSIEKNLTYEAQRLESMKAALSKQVDDLKQNIHHLMYTEDDDRSSIHSSVHNLRSELAGLTQEMDVAARIQTRLEAVQDAVNHMSYKESNEYSMQQQSDSVVAGAIRHMQSMLNLTAQDIFTTITEEERKQSRISLATNQSVASLKQGWEKLRGTISSVSKMIGPPGLPGPAGPSGMKVCVALELFSKHVGNMSGCIMSHWKGVGRGQATLHMLQHCSI
jgi:hypothetical protein